MENNKTYIVIAAHCNVVHRRTTLKRGEIKPASYFEHDQLARLVSNGYLVEHAAEASAPEVPEVPEVPAVEPSKFDAEKATVAELKIELTKLNIPFTASALKSDLVKAYNDNFLQ
jgi:hypothetical protein